MGLLTPHPLVSIVLYAVLFTFCFLLLPLLSTTNTFSKHLQYLKYSRYNQTSVLKCLLPRTIQFSTRLFTEKMSQCGTKLWFSYLTTLSCWYFSMTKSISQETNKEENTFVAS